MIRQGRFRKNVTNGGGVHNSLSYSLMTRENLFRTEGRRNFFSQRVMNVWNSQAFCDFKNKLDIAPGAKGIKRFGVRRNQDIKFDDQPQ